MLEDFADEQRQRAFGGFEFVAGMFQFWLANWIELPPMDAVRLVKLTWMGPRLVMLALSPRLFVGVVPRELLCRSSVPVFAAITSAGVSGPYMR